MELYQVGQSRPAVLPDLTPYDRATDDALFVRSLLSEEERRQFGDTFMTIAQLRAFVDGNTTKESMSTGGLDPDIIAMIDIKINYKIFIVDDHIYTREELYDIFPFHNFNVQPETIFVQQELGVFATDGADHLYVARDVGDTSIEFIPVEDIGLPIPRRPLRIVKTKVYIGRESWKDFLILRRMFRGVSHIAAIQGIDAPSIKPTMMLSLLAPQHAEIAQQRREIEQQRRDLATALQRIEYMMRSMQLPPQE